MVAQYQPDRGDFVFVDFSPHAGTEQAGRRPALVLSPKRYNIATSLIFACPITSQGKGSPFEVAVPKGAKLAGFVLVSQMRALDWIARRVSFHSPAPQGLLDDVLGRIEAIILEAA